VTLQLLNFETYSCCAINGKRQISLKKIKLNK
jgi:hypothetical protein